MRKQTRNHVVVILTLAPAAAPFVSDYAKYREEEALKNSANSLIFGVIRKEGDPMANHQADLLERLEHTHAKQKFIDDNKSNLGLSLSFVSAASAVALGYFALKEDKKL